MLSLDGSLFWAWFTDGSAGQPQGASHYRYGIGDDNDNDNNDDDDDDMMISDNDNGHDLSQCVYFGFENRLNLTVGVSIIHYFLLFLPINFFQFWRFPIDNHLYYDKFFLSKCTLSY